MIAVVDYGVGNLYSLTCSLRHIGADSVVTRDPETLKNADKVILPGVGAFGDAAGKLHARCNWIPCCRTLAAQGKPLLGVCLGMQLLFDKSFEYGEHEGLGLIRGHVQDMSPFTGDLKVPHMGWNSLDFQTAGRSPAQGYPSQVILCISYTAFTPRTATAHWSPPPITA